MRTSCLRRTVIGWFVGLAALAMGADVKSIIARHLEAVGGVEKLKQIKAMHIRAKGIFQGMEMPMRLWYKRPNRVRFEMDFQGQTMVQAYDGEKAWWIMPFVSGPNPQAMPEEEAKRFRHEGREFPSPFLNYGEKDYRFELVGEEDLEGTPVYRLRMTRPDGTKVDFFIDEETALILKQRVETTYQGQNVIAETVFGDYQAVEGLVMPFSIQTYVNGRLVNTMVIEEININIKVDDALFQMPSPAPSKGQ